MVHLRYLLMLLLACLPHYAAHAASTGGAVGAALVGPASMINTSPLDFGGIIPGGGGTVFINAQTGARTATGVVVMPTSFSRARFVGTGTRERVVTFDLDPTPIIISNGSATMRIDQIRLSINNTAPQPVGPNANTGSQGIVTFGIGGRLNVAANQAEGVYTGSFTVTMDYQ